MSLWSITPWQSLIIGVLLVIAVAIGGAKMWGKTVIGFPVERRDLLQTVVTTGRVTALARVAVASQLLGSIAEVHVEAGDRVRAGELLVQLRDEEERAVLDQARATEQELSARLKQIGTVDEPVNEQRLGEAEAALRQTQNSYGRIQNLYDAGISSRSELDEAVRARDVATGTVERERLQLTSSRPAGSDIKLAQARLNQARAAVSAAREQRAHTIIRARGDGTVIARNVEVGDVVQPGAVLLVLSRTGRTQITAQIDEKNLGLLRVGQDAVVSADAYPDKSFPARLATVVPAVDAQRGTVEVRCDVVDPPSYLVPDMTVSLEIEVARHSKVLTIPSESLRDASTTPWVLVVRNGRAVRQPVVLGTRGSGSSEVTKGLAEGEMVLPGGTILPVGSRIRLQHVAGENNRAH
ncbi:MAG: efflux RND transporter periplasmic adaptor subunit [Desulfuromonadaceae bacterium]|nr:efflux RND transporter periplasmic adaptor subunit [Desulfuromonadaceae bacterium]